MPAYPRDWRITYCADRDPVALDIGGRELAARTPNRMRLDDRGKRLTVFRRNYQYHGARPEQ